jgi:hypothetical protein
MQRYAGTPFLRLLECYVLWAIGELTPEDEQKLLYMTPKLRGVYNLQGTWHEIIAGQMELPADFPVQINALWNKNKQRAGSMGVELSAENFAQKFVDDNLP